MVIVCYVVVLVGMIMQLFDICKIVLGLCLVQKYVVCCGGGWNYCIGLYDGVLIKENYILVVGSIVVVVVVGCCMYFFLLLEVEVENFDELVQVLEVGVDCIMIDNFDLLMMCEVVQIIVRWVVFEVLGNVDFDIISVIGYIGVDFVFVGVLIKYVCVIDLLLCLCLD